MNVFFFIIIWEMDFFCVEDGAEGGSRGEKGRMDGVNRIECE